MINSRRTEKILALVSTLIGVTLLVSPFTILSGMSSGWVLVVFLGGTFFLILGALLASERTPVGEAARYQA